ncbi:Acyl-CoA dehydrogenase [Salinihabitans flavidus]|uniref:Acyl-CoA dehydrogenase n=1 Tax=Salinihabitans flavidus TaxID=569882 RepID=A0A1H8TMC5_9RHOB|nr:acyl-CoA dehydrogenase [Salinihabitans flavidus]SEO92209.1 Acyl-CoA dehydrogenase [Salinihabitans flavidus]
MQFEMSDDRQMLQDMLRRYLSENYDILHRNAVAYAAPFHDPDRWRALAELGVLQALAPEAAGGFGGEGFDIAAVFEALGGALCPEPVLPVAMAAPLLMAAGSDLETLLDGTRRYGVAIGEAEAPYSLSGRRASHEKGRLTGRKSVVYGGGIAESLLVAARHEGGGIGLYEVDAADAQILPYGMIDGGGAAEVVLEQTPATCLIEDAEAALQEALDFGALALCAEAVGAMDAVQAMLLEYLKTRRQFGVPIGKFQVLQHRAVDLAVEIEQARSITILAASRMKEPDRSRHVAMAKALIGQVAVLVAEEAIQMHGGIAMTWEAPVSHYAKRLVMLDAQLGDRDHHLRRLAAGYANQG